MKPITQNLIAGLAGTLIGAVLVFFLGRPWISDERVRNAESGKEENNVRERVHAYFDEQDISYEDIDSVATLFTYEDENYILYAPDDDNEFMCIWTNIPFEEDLSKSELPEKMHKAFYIQEHMKFLKVDIDMDRTRFRFAVEQYIDPNTDINPLLHRMIKVLSGSVTMYKADNDDYLLPDDGDTESEETIIG
jgi:hypothetical protein